MLEKMCLDQIVEGEWFPVYDIFLRKSEKNECKKILAERANYFDYLRHLQRIFSV